MIDREQLNFKSNKNSFTFPITLAGVFLLAFGVIFGLVKFLPAINLPIMAQNTQPKFATIFKDEPVARARSYPKDGEVSFRISVPFEMKIWVNRTPDGLDAIDSELNERCVRRIDKDASDWSVEKGYAFFPAGLGPKLLTCLMQNQRNRFCDAKYRKRFVDRFYEYIRAFEEAKRLKHKYTFVTTMDLLSEAETGSRANHLRVFPEEMFSRPMLIALRRLSDKGLLVKSDFRRWFSKLPPRFESYLSDKPRPC
jgi:hypothetical protein